MQVSIDTSKALGDMREIQFTLSEIIKEHNNATARAINRAIDSSATELSSQTREILNLKKARVDQDIKKIHASANNLEASMKSKGKPIGLINFMTSAKTSLKSRATEIKVKVLKNSPARVVEHAFLLAINNSLNIYKRKILPPERKPFIPYWDTAYIAFWARLPKTDPRKALYRATGPRIQDIQARPEVFKAVQDKADQTFKDRMEYELSRLVTNG